MTIGADGTSTRPYLLRALHDWCTDNGFTPYLAVHVGPGVLVPMEYVKNNEIVLNCGFEATSGLKLGNEFVEFKARFGGVARDIQVPVDHVVAIYARENGQGMAFPMPTLTSNDAATPSTKPHLGLASAGVGVTPGLRLAVGNEETTPVATPFLAPAPSPNAAPAFGPTLVGSTDSNQARPVHRVTEPPAPTDPAPPAGPRPTLKRIK